MAVGGVFGRDHRNTAIKSVGVQRERMSTQTPDTGTLRTTCPCRPSSDLTCSRAPVDECVARRLSGPSCTCQSAGSAMR